MSQTNPYAFQEVPTGEPPLSDRSNDTGPKGLGGWLILIGISVVFSPFESQEFSWGFRTFTQRWHMGSSNDPGSNAYHPLWAPLLIFEFVGNLAFMAAYIVLAVLFFRKSRFFPKLFIVLAISNLSFIVLDAWLGSFVLKDEPMFDPDTLKEVIRGTIGIAIWVPYMLISKRVKNTFV